MAAKSLFRGGFAPRFAWQTIRIIVVLVLLLGAVFVPTGTAQALSFTVNTTADTLDASLNGVCADASGFCSLRAAVVEANANPSSTITFAPALNGTPIILTRTGNDQNSNAGDLDINASMTITGNGPANTIIQGAADASYTGSIGDKIFGVNQTGTYNSLTVSFSGMTIRYGDNTIPYNDGSWAQTGAGIDIYQSGTGNSASLMNMVIAYNRNHNSYGGGLNFDQTYGATGSLTIDNVTFQDNQTLGETGDSWWGGGACLIGKSPTINISNSTFQGNSTPFTGIPSQGGAIYFYPYLGGSLTISNTTFSGNSSRQGGAISVYALAAATTITIQDSQFTGNTATEAGGGLYLNNSALNTTSFQLTELQIDGNTAGTSGGGVHVGGSSVNLQYSRIVNNISPTGADVYKDDPSSPSEGTLTAERNWWGCSTGAGGTGCDTAGVEAGGAADFDPWLRDLLSSGAGTTLVTNQTSALTASFLTDSAGGAVSTSNLSQIIGRPVTWSATPGNISGAQTTIQSGATATATFTATAAGPSVVGALVDGDSLSAGSNRLSITVNKANTTTTITSDAPDPSVVGQAVTVTFTVTGAYGNAPTPPTGNVTVSDGIYTCTGTVAAGFCNLTPTGPGLRTLTATYAGDANFNGSTSPGVAHQVLASPIVVNVGSYHLNGTFTVGEVIPITVTFNMPVMVTGTPQLALETGTTDQVANYDNGDGTATLIFLYTVQAGDASPDLDYINTNSLTLNGGTIRDAATNTSDAILTLPTPGAPGSLGSNRAIVIDTTAPAVTNVTSTSADGAYTAGAVIPITVTFSEPIYVAGTPQLTLETGAIDRVINYSSGSGTATLIFNYTVQTGDGSRDLDYTAATSLALNGGTIRDVINNDANLTLAAPGTAGSLGANKAIAVYTPLAFTSPNNVTFVAGNLGSFTITTTGAPAPTLGYTGTLPSGITFTDNGDGTAALSGMPVLSSVGTYDLVFTASNGVAPDATQNFSLTVDGPPGVRWINSVADTGDGQIVENEHAGVDITQLLVVFNKAMNSLDASSLGNYQLVQDGSTPVAIDGVVYDPTTQTTTVLINGSTALPNGRYTLTVKGDIEDIFDSPIGTDFIRTFYVDMVAPTLTLLAPTNGEALLYRRPTFDWSNVLDASSYQIAVSKNDIFSTVIWKVDTIDSTYTPTTDLPAEKAIYWRVRAMVNGVWGSWSETRGFTTANPPSIPVLVSPAMGSLTKDYTPWLDWSDSLGAHHYEVQLDTDRLFPEPVLIKDDTLITSSYTTPDLLANTRYFWRVRSFNAAGEYSSWSLVWSFRTAILPPGNLSPQGGETVSSRKPTLNWDIVDGASSYAIQLSTSSNFATLLVDMTTTTNNFTPLTKLPANTTIYWRVRALGRNGPSRWMIASFHTP